MGASFSDDDEVMSDINIVPFVDIILVVLIIFMLTAAHIETAEAIQVDLPGATTGEETSSISLGLTLTAEGRLLLDGEDTTPEALTAALHDAQAEASEVVTLIAADELVAHGRVVWLIDLVRSAGIDRFAINIDQAAMIPPDPATLDKGVAP